MDLNPFVNLIKNKCGLFFEGERLTTLASGVRNRMSAKGLESHNEYLNSLLYDKNEFVSLINLLTINETYFFREPQHFQILSERLIPEIFKKKGAGEKVRILSAGCSTGEEAYSIVISLMERYGRGIENIASVAGVDIDEDAVRRAKSGVFGRNSFRSAPDGIKERHFKKVGDKRYEIMDFIKENVEFKSLNLLSGFYPDALRNMDIIFYRNVSIYFDPDVQKSIFHKLSQILNEGGYLFVGSSETLSHNIGILSLINIEGVFLYHKGIEVKVEDRRKMTPEIRRRRDDSCLHEGQSQIARSHALRGSGMGVTTQSVVTSRAGGSIVERREKRYVSFEEALSLAMLKKYEDALRCIDGFIKENPSFVRGYALKAGILVNLRRIEEAKNICLKITEIARWDVEGYLLSGLIAAIEDNEQEAIKRFKEALYICPSCWLAHFYLAGLYNSRGEREQAYREYEITVKLLEKGGLSNNGLTFFPLSFPAEQIIHLCRHNLKKLKIDY